MGRHAALIEIFNDIMKGSLTIPLVPSLLVAVTSIDLWVDSAAYELGYRVRSVLNAVAYSPFLIGL